MMAGTGSGVRTYLFDPNGSTLNRVYAPSSPYTTQPSGWEDPHFYDAYGEPVWRQPRESGDPNTPANWQSLPFRYKGQAGYITDTDTDLIYCQHRVYDPKAGRWLTRDPIGVEGGINSYEYCDGNPVMNIDPSGLDTLTVLGDDDGVALSGLGYWLAKPLFGKELVRPSLKKFENALIGLDEDDDFFFWGHGAKEGKIWINHKEIFGPKQLTFVNVQRALKGKRRIKCAELHACFTADSAMAVNSWLGFAREVDAYCGLTADGTWPPKVNSISKYHSFTHDYPSPSEGLKHAILVDKSRKRKVHH